MKQYTWLPCILISMLTSLSLSTENFSKVTELEKLGNLSNPIELNTQQYMKYIINPDRPYHVILFMTMEGIACAYCKVLNPLIPKVAKTYRKLGKIEQRKPTSESYPLFFVRQDLNKNYEIQSLHNITHVPRLFYLPPFMKLQPNKLNKSIFYPLPEDVEILDEITSTNDLMAIVDRVLDVKEPTKPQRSFMESALASVVTSFIVILVLLILHQIFKIAKNRPHGLPFIAFIIHCLATSGFCWCLIHGFEWFNMDSTKHQILIFSPDRRSQFVLEGLLISFCVAGTGLALWVASSYFQHKTLTTMMYVQVLILCIFAICLFQFVMHRQHLKNGFSFTGFFPPKDTIKGPLAKDRGLTVL